MLWVWSENTCSAMWSRGKRPCAFASSSSESSSDNPDYSSASAKRRSTTATTVERWKFENDRELQTSVWLKYEMADRQHVSTLSCSVCTQFQSKLRGMRNFNPAYIEGSKNIRASSFKEHAASDMHSRAMLLLKRKQSTNVLD